MNSDTDNGSRQAEDKIQEAEHLGFYYPDGIDNSVLEIRRIQSSFTKFFYQIREKYQITYEYISGTGPEDYLNVLTLSGDQAYFSRESVQEHNRFFRSDLIHYHDFYELMIVLEGTVVNCIEGQDYQYPAGAACLINRGLRHTEGFLSPSRVLYIGLSTEYIRELEDWCRTSRIPVEQELLESPMLSFIGRDMKEPGRRDYLDFFPAFQKKGSYRTLYRNSESLLEALLRPFCGASHVVRGLIAELLAFLNSPYYHCSNIELAMNKDYLLFSRVSSFMEERNGRFSRAELPALFNYSADYLNRIVRKYSGLSLYDYGMQFRLKEAEEYLKNSDYPVSEIAVRCGFTNKTHFYKHFEARYHMTPYAFRKENTQPAPEGRNFFPENARHKPKSDAAG